MSHENELGSALFEDRPSEIGWEFMISSSSLPMETVFSLISNEE